ncbi:MAG: flavodoxin domain-containing protein [Chlamydiota bacterium]
MITEIAKNVYWVGVIDWGLRKFHGDELSTHRGSTYNAYVIKDEKNVLIDTVWTPFREEFMEKLREVIDPAEIDIVVANHSEVDHSGALPEVMRYATNGQLVVSKRGKESIPGHYHEDWPLTTVGTGDKINIGSRDLMFIEAPMLHWPDSMFTYLTGDNILMPNDAFGQHYATEFRFNDEVDQHELYEHALKYYVNILTPFSKQVISKIDELLSLNLPVDMIAPSHGVLWRDNPLQIVEKYREWAEQEPEESVLIIYDTMWNGTRRMADAISEGCTAEGVPNKVFHASHSDRNDLMVEVFKAKTIVVGSPTFNDGVLPSLSPLLRDLTGLKFQNKIGAVFGSYGWNGKAIGEIKENLQKAKFDVLEESITCKWQPSNEDLEKCREYGKNLAKETVKKK